MREHKFKAKSIDSGEWVEGNYVFGDFKKGNKHYISFGTPSILSCYSNYMQVNLKEVIPETVCQYINFKDENNKEIFEEDMLSDNKTGDCYIVRYFDCKCGYVLDCFDGQKKIWDFYDENTDKLKLEMVGNIHDGGST